VPQNFWGKGGVRRVCEKKKRRSSEKITPGEHAFKKGRIAQWKLNCSTNPKEERDFGGRTVFPVKEIYSIKEDITKGGETVKGGGVGRSRQTIRGKTTDGRGGGVFRSAWKWGDKKRRKARVFCPREGGGINI